MRGKISLLPGEVLQAHEVDIFEKKKCVVTTNCKKSAEVIVLGGKKKPRKDRTIVSPK